MMKVRDALIMLICLSMFVMGADSVLYLPGVPPKKYESGDPLPVIANALQSMLTLTPFDIYALPFCEPIEGIRHQKENWEERLWGDVENNTPFNIHMMEEKECELLCTHEMDAESLALISERIREEYFVNLDIDSLPAARKMVKFDTKEEMDKVVTDMNDPDLPLQDKQDELNHENFAMEMGFPLGKIDEDTGNVQLNNHWEFMIGYDDDGHIVEFEMVEWSINHQVSNSGVSCGYGGAFGGMVIDGPSGFDEVNSMDISWTYSVTFFHSEMDWAQRWAPYLKIRNVRVHWVQLLMDLWFAFMLLWSASLVLVRALKRDISSNGVSGWSDPPPPPSFSPFGKGNNATVGDFMADEDWESLAGDIFRAPKYPLLMAILLGAGKQITLVTVGSIVLSAIGIASPAMHRSLISCAIFLFVVTGAVNGFDSARWYRFFGGTDSFRMHVIKTAVFYPAFNFVVFLMVDLIVWADSGSEATHAVPFGTFLALIAIFTLMSFPMVWIGAHYGYKSKEISVPCEARQIPRLVPSKPWYMRKEMMCILSGFVVFNAAYLELTIILTSVWGHRIYFAFGFLMVTFWLMMMIAALCAILVVYNRLVHEDYNWWWISFFAPASSGVVMFMYCVRFFFTEMHVAVMWTSYATYFGYMFLASAAVSLMTGFAGFTATFVFLNTIYGAIKSD